MADVVALHCVVGNREVRAQQHGTQNRNKIVSTYLSGSTGQISDMRTVVRGFYQANLVVLNIEDVLTTGPEEAAFVVDRLFRPQAVIPSHANEVATTSGAVNRGTRTARFIQLVRGVPVYPPLSGVPDEVRRRSPLCLRLPGPEARLTESRRLRG